MTDKMTMKDFEKQADEMFESIGKIVENAPIMMVAEIAINLIEVCLLSMTESGQRMIAGGVTKMFRDVSEEMKRREKLDS